MEISPLFFYLFGGSAIAFSLFVVLKKNPVVSAFSLVMVFFSFAGIYALLDAHLIAALQILVYAGAIMVLFVFVIMLLNTNVPHFKPRQFQYWMYVPLIVLLVAMLGLLAWVFHKSPTASLTGLFTPESIESSGGNTQVLSELLFSEYLLPFELTSVLLLAAIVGAVAIAKRKVNGGHLS